MFTKNILRYGKDQPLPEQIPLKAGVLTAIYDNGDLRYIRMGDQEIVWRLYCAVRDHNWGTIAPQLKDVDIQQSEDSFRITYTAHHVDASLGIDFQWQATITGTSESRIRFEMQGQANSTFRRNRIGFCILHPMTLAGQPITVEHDGGTSESATFPLTVAPDQPFLDIRAIRHPVGSDAQASIFFEGDIFEMEDQRNWTDASYKTYCTPLANPFPVEVPAGEQINQAVTITLEGAPQVDSETGQAPVVDVSQGETVPLPAIGLGIASHGLTLTPAEIERLQRLNLDHLRLDLHMDEDFLPALQMAAQQATSLGTTLLLAVHLTDAAASELDQLASTLTEQGIPVCAFMIFHEAEKATASERIALAKDKLAAFNVPIGGGTDAFFTELNRDRPAADDRDFSTFSTNPQVHAFEVQDLAETIACHAAIIQTASAFNHGKPIYVSPVTLKMRFNPNATGPQPETPPGQLQPQVDVRQMSLFGAGWTLGSLKYLSSPDVQRITLYETTGQRGLMETEHAEAVDASLYPSEPGMIFAIYHVLAAVADFVEGELVKITTSTPLAVDGVLLKKGDRWRILLANLTHQPQSVRLRGVAVPVAVQSLDDATYEQAAHDPAAFQQSEGELRQTLDEITLSPFAILRIDPL